MSLDDLDLSSKLELEAILSSNDLQSGSNVDPISANVDAISANVDAISKNSRNVLITGLTNQVSGEALRQMLEFAGKISEVCTTSQA